MAFSGPSISADDVLRAFRYDAPYLFLGAAFMTVGLVSAGFAALRRMREPLLIFFGILAGLYGLRLWVQADISRLLAHGSIVYSRLYSAVNYLVPIPFVLYLQSAGLLLSRMGMGAAYALALGDGV